MEYKGKDSEEFLSIVRSNINDFPREDSKLKTIDLSCEMIKFKKRELEELLDLLKIKSCISRFCIADKNKSFYFAERGTKKINSF